MTREVIARRYSRLSREKSRLPDLILIDGGRGHLGAARKALNKIKGLVKEFQDLVSQQKVEKAKKLLPQIYKAIDKAAKVNVLKKNTAARKKSKITRATLSSEKK